MGWCLESVFFNKLQDWGTIVLLQYFPANPGALMPPLYILPGILKQQGKKQGGRENLEKGQRDADQLLEKHNC